MKKHILVVASTFPSTDNDPVPAFVKDQIIAMKRVDPELTFSVLAPHDYRSKTKSLSTHESYTEHRFHYFWPFSAEILAGRGIVPTLKKNPALYLLVPFLFIGEFFSLRKIVRKEKPDLVYAHWFTPQAITASWVSNLTKTPFVFTTHASDVSIWRKIPFGDKLVRSVSSKAEAITAVSTRSIKKLSSFFDDKSWGKDYKEKAHIIPMGTETNLPAPSKKDSENLKKDLRIGSQKTILFIGRLAEKKGVAYLLRAFAELKNDLKNLPILLIAGDGPLKEELKNLAKELDLEQNVRFVGYATGELKSQLFTIADIVTLPSIITDGGDAEGLPVVLMEALAAGKICIATNESGADDILDTGVDGYLIPQKDEEAIVLAIKQALAMSPSEQSAMTGAAKSCAKQFSWDAIAKQHIDTLFKKVLKD